MTIVRHWADGFFYFYTTTRKDQAKIKEKNLSSGSLLNVFIASRMKSIQLYCSLDFDTKLSPFLHTTFSEVCLVKLQIEIQHLLKFVMNY